MTDREILEKYIDLDNSCLNEEEKERSYEYVASITRKHLDLEMKQAHAPILKWK